MDKMTIPARYKNFNGKRYCIMGYASTKANANRIVKGYKTLGFKTKIISFMGRLTYDDMNERLHRQYAVYVSIKKNDMVKK